MVTYVNDLRLSELATGEGSGTWGTTTNTNLELIGEALGYGTEQSFSSDADATTTIGDGVSDPARAMYFKVTSAGSLTATRTLTIAPNTVSRVMFIENATTGSQSIAISQGSGASVTILTGKTAVVYLDGAGATAAVVDAMSGVDPGVTDTLTEVLVAGNTSGGTNIELSTTDKVQFRDAAIYLNSSVDGQLDIVADTEIQIAATTVDLNGNLDVSGTALVTGVLTTTAATVFNGGFASNADSTLGTDKKVQFRDAAIYINSSVDGQLDIVADTEIQIAATTIDINGAINASGEIIAASLDISGDVDIDGTTNLDVVDIDGAVDMASTLTVGSTISINEPTQTTYGLVSKVKSVYLSSTDATYANLTIRKEAATSTDYLQIRDSGNALLANLTSLGGLITAPTAGGHTIFNEAGVDADFRVESDNNANMLFVDASTSRIGIGESNPGDTLQINGGNIVNPNSTGSEITSATVGVGGNIHLEERQPDGAFSDRTDLVIVTNTGFGVGESDKLRLAASGAITTYPVANADTVFNESGVDADFRVESNDNENMLFVNGGTSQVVIGGSTSGTYDTLTVNHFGASANNNAGITIDANASSGTGQAALRLLAGSGSTNRAARVDFLNGVVSTTVPQWTILNDYLQDGTNDFNIISGGSDRRLVLTSGSAVFNEIGSDVDFRVESDNIANALLVDASTDNVLVGTNNNSQSVGDGVKLKYYGAVQVVNDSSTGGGDAFSYYSSSGSNYRFWVNGSGQIASTSTSITSLSDQRLKENIRDLDDGLSKVMQLQPRKFDWKEGKGKNIANDRGFIAQEFEQVFPDLIDEWKDKAPEGEEPYKSVSADLIPTLVKAIQEQNELIEDLRARVAQLENT
jgi:cytoskeletal protein CcmA (bactofilin family)